jgi:hypothetical protein
MTRGELADQDDPRAGRLELLPGAIQLDRVSLAINSAVVTEPHQRDRLLRPEVAEPHLVAVLVE